MKQILLHNWKIKLTCLALASVVWYLIQHNINPAEAAARNRPKAEQSKE